MLKTALFALVSLCALVSNLFAQQTCRVHLHDGSTIHCKILTTLIAVETAYGTLQIPVQDVRSIKFGLHPTAEQTKSIDVSIKRLNSEIHKERVLAAEHLKSLGKLAVPALRRLADSSDVECRRRAEDILNACACAMKGYQEEDLVETARLSVTGRITSPALGFKSDTLGDITIKCADVESLSNFMGVCCAFNLDAGIYGDTWLATKAHLAPGQAITISAKGQIDLWPQSPNQYLCGPRGYNTAGKGSHFMAGALIAKIGEHGIPFTVGEQTSITAEQRGTLYLMVVPSPWNSPSSGVFSVEVKDGK